MNRRERVGIFGGTFNPIHLGHLRAAEEACEALSLTRVLFVPSASPPHKAASAVDPLADARLRLAWARAATAGNPRLAVDDLEIERGGASYTLETLREIGRRTAPELPTFVIGCDAFAELHSWHQPQRVLELAHFAVLTRPPLRGGTLADWLPKFPDGAVADLAVDPDGDSARHRRTGARIERVEISALEISSSDVRRRLRAGLSVRYLLPEEVRAAVESSGVYA